MIRSIFAWEVKSNLVDGWVKDSFHNTYEQAVLYMNASGQRDMSRWRLVRRTEEVIEPPYELPDPDVKPVVAKPAQTSSSPLATMNAAINRFNEVADSSVSTVVAGEPVDQSLLRVMAGVIEGVTKKLDQIKEF